jgi:hypothetical protein
MLRSKNSFAAKSTPRARNKSVWRIVTLLVAFAVLLMTSQAWPFAASAPSSVEAFEREAKPFEMMTRPNTASKSSDEPKSFEEALKKALKKRKLKLENVCAPDDLVARRVLADYGAMFVASKKVLPPPVCVFADEDAVTQFQIKAQFDVETINDAEIELQPAAMEALRKAREVALKEGLDITPRGGAEAARRGYKDTLEFWGTRFEPALVYWQEQGRLSAEQAERLRRLPLREQVAEVLTLEQSGIFFSKDLTKSILYSVAAPGTSQHLSMLALDVTEFENERVRAILAEHGWFQTVLSDLPHFTFLGLKEKELAAHGLRPVTVDNQVFWIPNIDPLPH